jgi:hypothetical protein
MRDPICDRWERTMMVAFLAVNPAGSRFAVSDRSPKNRSPR